MLKTNIDALAALSKHFNVELQFNSQDVADFFVEGIQILFYGIPTQSKLVLVAEIDSTLDLNSPKALKELLQANHLGAGTGAAKFSLDPTTGDLHLNQTLDVLHLSSDHLIEEVTKFLKYAIFWNSRISEFIKDEEITSTPSDVSSANILRV